MCAVNPRGWGRGITVNIAWATWQDPMSKTKTKIEQKMHSHVWSGLSTEILKPLSFSPEFLICLYLIYKQWFQQLSFVVEIELNLRFTETSSFLYLCPWISIMSIQLQVQLLSTGLGTRAT